MENSFSTARAIDITIKLVLLALITAWCLILVFPFGSIITWSIILAMAMSPLFLSLTKKMGNRPKLAASLLVISGLLIILIPAWLFMNSIVEGVREIKSQFEAETLTIPPPPPHVSEWPLIGDQVFSIWSSASSNLQETIVQYKDQLAEVGGTFIQKLLSVGASIFQFIAATIIAGILLVTTGTRQFSQKFFSKIIGGKANEISDLAQLTVNNVVKGVLGVALIQAFLTGLGFLLAGVPYAGLWALLVFILAILQLPATLVTLPVIFYLFTTIGTLPAVLWTIYLVAAGLSDNILKPILLGKGAPVPMLVIFLGVIGGFMTMGFIGLFIGAIVLSLGYKLFISWVNEGEPETES